MARILLIDDDDAGRQMGAYNLRKAGHEVDEAGDGEEGLASFDAAIHDLVITDLKMPRLGGMDVIAEVHQRAAGLPVLVITAFGSIETAVEAMQAGAFDFVVKPFNRDQLLLAVDKALDRVELQRENRELKRRLRGVERPIHFVSELMREAVALADRVASSEAPVLILGESGTGKELIARRLHSRSARAEGPFVAVNCAAIPAELMEAELFGHEKGAFTNAARARMGRFRQAEHGTLLLDEVAELPVALQSKLLRAVQEKVVDPVGADEGVAVDVRVIAATQRDLRAAIADGSFREDLYYRLNVVEISMPPLRDRPEDIPALARQFIRDASPDRELEVPEQVVQALSARSWPGNVRELQNACERLAILSDGGGVSAADLGPEAGASSSADWPELPSEGLSLLDLEKRVIERVLALKQGNVSAAARYLGVPRHVLAYRIEKYGIRRGHG